MVQNLVIVRVVFTQGVKPFDRQKSSQGRVFHRLAGDDALLTFQELFSALELHGFDLHQPEVERIWQRAFGEHSLSRSIGFEEFLQGADGVPFLKMLLGKFEQVDHPFETPEGYDYGKSTNENYGVSPGSREFFGEYADIRAGIDYGYHVNYTEARQLWQDGAVNSTVMRTLPQASPWIVYTCGPMGAGKGFALSWMSRHGYFPLEEIVHIDPDHFKKIMPEWAGYTAAAQASGGDNLAGNHCHRESGFIQEIAQEVAMRHSQNVWVDGSLRDGDWFKKVFLSVRIRFPQYKIAIFEVTASEANVRERIKERAAKTGRDVPEELIRSSLKSVSDSIHKLTPLCDFVAKIDNNGSQPELTAYSVVDTSKDWGLIAHQFAKPPLAHFPQSLSPLALVELGPLSEVMKQAVDSSPNNMRLHLCNSHPALKAVAAGLVDGIGGTTTLACSHSHLVTLPKIARKEAGIPDNADTYVFAYPSDLNAEKISGFTYTEEDRACLLPLAGGFVYFDSHNEVCGVNAVLGHCPDMYDSADDTAEKLPNKTKYLQFALPEPLPSAAIDELMSSQRMQPVTLQALADRGALEFAWIRPGEQLAGMKGGTASGAFAYRMKEDCEGHIYFAVTA